MFYILHYLLKKVEKSNFQDKNVLSKWNDFSFKQVLN